MNEYDGFSGEEEPEEDDGDEFDAVGSPLSVAVVAQGELVILAVQIDENNAIMVTFPPLVAEELAEEFKKAAEEAKKGWTVEAILAAGENGDEEGEE